MRAYPINDLQICSVRNCRGQTVTIIRKTIGEEQMMYGYCDFHSVISATFFSPNTNRTEIPFLRMGN